MVAGLANVLVCTYFWGHPGKVTKLEIIHLELTNQIQLRRQFATRKAADTWSMIERVLGQRVIHNHWAERVRRQLHCTKAPLIGDRYNIQLWRGKVTGKLTAGESKSKTLAAKGCIQKRWPERWPEQCSAGRRETNSFVVVLPLFCLCFPLNSAHRTFRL